MFKKQYFFILKNPGVVEFMSVTLVLEKLRQENYHELEAFLDCNVKLCLKTQQNKEKIGPKILIIGNNTEK